MNELESMWEEVAMISAAGSSWHLLTERTTVISVSTPSLQVPESNLNIRHKSSPNKGDFWFYLPVY
jgi:hypothetical protein